MAARVESVVVSLRQKMRDELGFFGQRLILKISAFQRECP